MATSKKSTPSKTSTKKTTAQKPAVKKPAAQKAAAREPTSRKPAVKKPAAKKPATAKKPAASKRTTGASGAGKARIAATSARGLTATQRELLLGLDTSFARALDRSVAEQVQESRELESTLRRYDRELHKNTRLDRKVSGSLAARRAILEAAEAEWSVHRVTFLPRAQRQLREEGEQLKRDVVASLRHFLEEDEDVQRRVDAIQIGSGLADLLDDLGKLADLVDEHGEALERADLPEDVSGRMRALVDQLGDKAAEERTDTTGASALALRNRAFWYLRQAMDEVRSAGRYAFRHQPRLLRLFRSTPLRRTSRSQGSEAPAPTAPAPAASNKR